jgi:phosphatidylinositol kinase/protein kinase (PI-3  family)
VQSLHQSFCFSPLLEWRQKKKETKSENELPNIEQEIASQKEEEEESESGSETSQHLSQNSNEQEENGTEKAEESYAFAHDCVALVQKKLEGAASNPKGEVQKLIESASNPKNLMIMFEGWMPWV